MKFLMRVVSNLMAWRYCQHCMGQTDQKLMGQYWLCTSCNHKLDRSGRVLKNL